MGLVSVKGKNPFKGQKDPYISTDTSIGTDGANLSITLNGVITGCEPDDIINAQNTIAAAFDWKADRDIPSQTVIGGIAGSQDEQIIATSLDFASTNYIGSANYTINFQIFTGFGDPNRDPFSPETFFYLTSGESGVTDRKHTITTSIDNNGCKTVSRNISCIPAPDYAWVSGNECSGITASGIEIATNWINNQLGARSLGGTNFSNVANIDSESMSINPINSEVSYVNQYSEGCDNTSAPLQAATPDPANSGYQVAICSETTTSNPECGFQATSETKVEGEIYNPSGTPEGFVNYFNNNVVGGQEVHNLSASYSNQRLKFSYIERDQSSVAQIADHILYDETISSQTSYTYGKNASEVTTKSINGTISLLNPVDKTPADVLAITDDLIKIRVKGNAGGGFKLQSFGVSRDFDAGTVSYSSSFSDKKPDQDKKDPKKILATGVSRISVSYNAPVDEYRTMPTLNCDDLLIKTDQKPRGSVSISLDAQSGSGYDFRDIAQQEMDNLRNRFIGAASGISVEGESSVESQCGTAINMNYSASFDKESSVDENQITSMY